MRFSLGKPEWATKTADIADDFYDYFVAESISFFMPSTFQSLMRLLN